MLMIQFSEWKIGQVMLLISPDTGRKTSSIQPIDGYRKAKKGPARWR